MPPVFFFQQQQPPWKSFGGVLLLLACKGCHKDTFEFSTTSFMCEKESFSLTEGKDLPGINVLSILMCCINVQY